MANKEDVGAGVLEDAKEAGIAPDILKKFATLPPEVLSSKEFRFLLTDVYKHFDKWRFREMIDKFVQGVTTQNKEYGACHIATIAEVLVPYAFKWKSIGTALWFQPSDLDRIEARNNLSRDRDMLSLMEMIEIWVKGDYTHTRKPTIVDLKAALKSQLVGLGSLASKLGGISPAVHFSIHSVPWNSNSNFDLMTTEGSFHLFKVKNSSDSQIDVRSFQWQINGVEQHHDVSPFFFISADIDYSMNQYSCYLTTSEYKSFQTSAMTVSVSCPLDSFSDSLVSMYLDQPEVPEDTWPPVSSKKFVNIALIRQERINYKKHFAQITIRRDLDDIPLAKEKIEYEQLMDDLKSGHVLFIEGRPGSGKTTFVHKISQDWATKVKNGYKGPLRLLLLVSLRVLNTFNKPSLDLIDILNLFRKLKVSRELVEEREGKGVCFIFDGLDEFSPQDGEHSVVYRIIKKEYLEKSTVIIASRPAATAPLRSKATKVVEVLGFLNEQIWEYFDCYPFTEKSKIAELKQYLLDHPNVFHMCYLPIHATMVAYLHDVTGHIPRTETEMYTHFTRLTILRSLSKSTHARDIDVHNLSSEEEKVYNDICHLAYDKTMLNKQVLKQSECKFKLGQGEGDISLGLIVVDHTAGLYGYEKIYTFLHLTFQEYLAACYISKLSSDEQCQVVNLYASQNHMLVVWKFFCGLVKITPSDSRLKTILRLTSGNFLNHLQYAYESQQPVACTQVLKSMEYHIQLKDTYLTTPDFAALGYVTDKSVIPIKLTLINCTFNIDTAIHAFDSELKIKGKSLIHKLHYEKMDAECMNKFSRFLSPSLKDLAIDNVPKNRVVTPCFILDPIFSSLTKLSLKKVGFFCELTGSSTNNLTTLCLSSLLRLNDRSTVKNLSIFLKSCSNLKFLDISFNNLSDDSATLLATGLFFCRNLEEIIILNNKFTERGLREILKSLRYCSLKIDGSKIVPGNIRLTNQVLLASLADCTSTCLQSLSLEIASPTLFECLSLYSRKWKKLKRLVATSSSWQHRKIHDISVLSRCLKDFSALEVLQLTSINFSVEQSEKFASGLRACSNLQILNLDSNSIGVRQIEDISKHIKCSALQQIHLNDNKIDSKGAEILSNLVHKLKELQELHLRGNNISGIGAKALLKTLAMCHNLKVLDLGNNDLKPDVSKSLSFFLEKCKKLEQLHIDHNEVDCVGAESIASSFQSCCNLVELVMSSCSIGNAGAMALSTNLHHCSRLRKLDLSYNGINSSTAENVISGLKQYGLNTQETTDKVTTYRLFAPSYEIVVKI